MAPLTVGDCFSGIGGFSLGFDQAGARTLWFCEADEPCRNILKRHWPGIPRFRDVRTITGAALRANGLVPDVLVGGFPCQDVSQAGRRAGLAGERSGLFFEFLRLASECRPRWIVIENVPGLLSSNKGKDFGTILGSLAECGYMGAWRVLDAQYFGVAQRRRRVFVVGHRGDGRRVAQVLLEPESSLRDPPARPATRQEAARSVAAGTRGYGINGGGDVSGPFGSNGQGGLRTTDLDTVGAYVTQEKGAFSVYPEFGQGSDLREIVTSYAASHDVAPCLQEREWKGQDTAVTRPLIYRKTTRAHHGDDWERWEHTEAANTLDAEGNVTRTSHAVASEMAVRRLTPVECERLQGFPDGWTDDQKDTHRYRQLGNAVAVPVVAWLARRIVAMEDQT